MRPRLPCPLQVRLRVFPCSASMNLADCVQNLPRVQSNSTYFLLICTKSSQWGYEEERDKAMHVVRNDVVVFSQTRITFHDDS